MNDISLITDSPLAIKMDYNKHQLKAAALRCEGCRCPEKPTSVADMCGHCLFRDHGIDLEFLRHDEQRGHHVFNPIRYKQGLDRLDKLKNRAIQSNRRSKRRLIWAGAGVLVAFQVGMYFIFSMLFSG